MTLPVSSPVRVRFAPSPTGLLHIGGLRTALYNYLFAQKKGGTFVLRIEDTDQGRYVAEAEPDILDSLRWAGLKLDEGPGVGGPHAPYYQSQRKKRYQELAQQLVDEGKAYLAFDTADDIQAMRERLQAAGNASPTYNAATRLQMNNSLACSAAEVEEHLAAGTPFVIRLKVVPGERVLFEDAIRGPVAFDTEGIDDQVLLKSDGLPTYHLANVIDDHDMAITHVIRGEEWLPSTPKHLLLYKAFGWRPPQMAHLPLILSPNGGKLSKRNADRMGIPVSVQQYRAEGYEPEALINFLAFLGWNPGTEQELFSLDELVDAFSIERVGSAGVQFNLEKLAWFNAQHLRQLPLAELAQRVRPELEKAGYEVEDAYLQNVVQAMRERIHRRSDVVNDGRYFFEDPVEYDEKGVAKRWKPDSATLMRLLAETLLSHPDFNAKSLDDAIHAFAEENEVGLGRIMAPVRLALTGVMSGPSVFEMMEVLGREICNRRLKRAAERLG